LTYGDVLVKEVAEVEFGVNSLMIKYGAKVNRKLSYEANWMDVLKE